MALTPEKDPYWILSRSLRSIHQFLIKKIETSENRISTELHELKRIITNLGMTLNNLNDHFNSIDKRISNLEAQYSHIESKLINSLEENQLLLKESSQYQNKLTDEYLFKNQLLPLITQLISLLDVFEQLKSNSKDSVHLNPIYEHFLNILSDFNITAINYPVGSKFDPECMKAVELINTDNPNLNKTIYKTFSVGYSWKNLLIREQSIVLLKYQLTT